MPLRPVYVCRRSSGRLRGMPPTVAHPTNPLKSVIVEGSAPVAGRKTWKPLVNVSTDMDRNPDYVKLQTELLALSQNSKEIIAENSGHFVIIDGPDVVTDAISHVVQSVRNNAKL